MEAADRSGLTIAPGTGRTSQRAGRAGRADGARAAFRDAVRRHLQRASSRLELLPSATGARRPPGLVGLLRRRPARAPARSRARSAGDLVALGLRGGGGRVGLRLLGRRPPCAARRARRAARRPVSTVCARWSETWSRYLLPMTRSLGLARRSGCRRTRPAARPGTSGPPSGRARLRARRARPAWPAICSLRSGRVLRAELGRLGRRAARAWPGRRSPARRASATWASIAALLGLGRLELGGARPPAASADVLEVLLDLGLSASLPLLEAGARAPARDDERDRARRPASTVHRAAGSHADAPG